MGISQIKKTNAMKKLRRIMFGSFTDREIKEFAKSFVLTAGLFIGMILFLNIIMFLQYP